MRLSIELLLLWALFSQPLFQWLDARSIITFYSANGGVRAKQRNVGIIQKGDSFLGSKPGPFFNFSTLFSSRLIFLLLSSARVGATLSPRWSVVVTDHSSNPLGTNWSELECRLLGQFDPKNEVPADRIEWALLSRSSGRVYLTRTKSHQFESPRGFTLKKCEPQSR